MIADKERELAEINQTQDVVIDLLSNYKKAFVVGGAGTGKTWIGIKKAKRCAALGKKALYICCNKTLAKTIRTITSDSSIDCYDLDSMVKKLLADKYEELSNADGVIEYSSMLSEISDLPRYDLIVVDEAQDFTEDWAYSINLFLNESAELFVLYDESQMFLEEILETNSL